MKASVGGVPCPVVMQWRACEEFAGVVEGVGCQSKAGASLTYTMDLSYLMKFLEFFTLEGM